MAWGQQQYGLGSWGSGDFAVTNHSPADNSTGNPRQTTISFTLTTVFDTINVGSIDLTANGIQLILNGVFTSHATGTITVVTSTLVNVSATVTHPFASSSTVSIVVAALTNTLDTPGSGTTWQFDVGSELLTFPNYVVNRFEKVLRVSAVGLDAPENPMAIPEP